MNGHTWHPASLITLAANPPAPPTIGGMLYPGKRILLSGETESPEDMVGADPLQGRDGRRVLRRLGRPGRDGLRRLLARLRALGVTDDVISSRFLYYEPAERLINDVLVDVIGAITERKIRLFVVDAFNPMLSLHGLDPSSTPDIETFWREVADPICRAGAAPTLLDHVAKNAGASSRYAYGSERKASGAIVHIGFRLLTTLTRGGEGRALLDPPQGQTRIPAQPQHWAADPRLRRREGQLPAGGRRDPGRRALQAHGIHGEDLDQAGDQGRRRLPAVGGGQRRRQGRVPT